MASSKFREAEEYLRNCELIRRNRRLDEVKDTVDGFQGVIEVGLIVEPEVTTKGFANLQRIDAT